IDKAGRRTTTERGSTMTNRTMIATIIAATLAVTAATAAQRYTSPRFNSCIHEFYDSSMYNWLAFENACGQRLSVTYIGYNYPYSSYAADINPGKKTSTGLTRREVDERGGFELYVCESGFLPVDASDQYVTRPNTQFRCKER